MNFDEYMKKIQYIANLLEHNEYAENIINGKEIDVIEDFQYICLCNASNPRLVNDIIARIAQNGNAEVVLKNIKNISLSMWKDLFDKNEHIKNIFIDNYELIFNNASILTFREIERFIDNFDTCNLIYGSLNSIIKKLCTYDRASLIILLKSKEGGIDRIKSNLESFFQKGEFDISTTYSKICIELSKIEQITKLEILDICSKNLDEMLNRETAIDNETNKMLNWLYDTFEETKMTDEDRSDIKEKIDNAIINNFDCILDKSNYDKNTIKILKQFDCTKEKFEDNKNHYIDKSNKANNENINYTMNITDIDDEFKFSEKADEIVENQKCNINVENDNLKDFIPNTENVINTINKNNEISQNNQYNINFDNEENNILNIVPFHEDSDTVENYDNIDYGTNTVELFEIDEDQRQEKDNIIDFNKEHISSSKENINEEMKLHEIKLSNIDKEVPHTLDDSIKKLIYANIEDTDKIIERVLKKDNIENQVEQNFNKIVQNINVPESNGLEPSKQIINGNNIEKNILRNTDITNQNTVDNNVFVNKIEETKQTDLIVTKNELETVKKENIIQRIWKKILKIFKLGEVKDKI